jgi:arylsulfatase A-like enzyme
MFSRFLAILVFLSLAQPVLSGDAVKPNVIFVLADDLGWGELGCYGNGFNETPHLDRLAKGGMRFTQAYAAAPVCSPYRAALLTGQYPARVGITDYLRPNSANALSTDHLTLPEMFRRGGYRTGMIGKWHLTGYAHHGAEHEVKPVDQGFGWEIAREVKGVGNGANFWPYVFRDQGVRWINIPENRLGEEEFLVDRMNREAVDFIERNKDGPFFLYLSHYAPHTILNGKPELVEKYRSKHAPGKSTREKCYLCKDRGRPGDSLHHWAGDHNPHLAAMLESIDDGIGMVRNKLDELGLADNTIVIFTSDNGGETNVTSNAPLRGGKSELYEGGIRVPMVVHWPGQTPASSVCSEAVSNVDFYPTLLEAAGIEADEAQPLDGVSILPTWRDSQGRVDRSALYWHYPLDRAHFLGGRSSGAIRQGGWKLIEFFDTGESELYALNDDPAEEHNIASDHPQMTAMLKASLLAWRQSVDARTPSPPMLVEPRRLTFAEHFSTGQISSRWFFNGDWEARSGFLLRDRTHSTSTRIFAKDLQYRDTLIRFDFRLAGAKDIRFLSGSEGSYNAVVHIHPDHFRIQTAKDKSGPYFPHWHGECAYQFVPNRWYTMTVEFLGDQLVAHIDRAHVAYAQHPVLDKTRDYFAFQVDDGVAAFDNVQVFTTREHSQVAVNLRHIKSVANEYPVPRSLDEQLRIARSNAHDQLYRTDRKYRKLVEQVEERDSQNKKAFPTVFRTHKEIHKEAAKLRRKLQQEDPRYKELLFATHRATRALDAFLIAQAPRVSELPESRRKRELERLRERFHRDSRYLSLVTLLNAAQTRLEEAYPRLFVANEQINTTRKRRREELRDDPGFREANNARAASWRAQQEYLTSNGERVAELQRKIESTSDRNQDK